MANAINSPTAQNLSHKSIIELANITYENARAAVEAKGQADDAAEAAAASASAADNSADLADLSKMAAAASAAAANADMITASNKAIVAANSANAAADSAADAAAIAAEVAAALSSKVDKTTNNNVVYATDDRGNPLPLKYGASHTPTSAGYGSIVYRTRSGYFNVLDATNDQHPAAYHQAKRFYHSVDSKNDINPGGDVDGHLTFICTAKSTGYYSTFAALAQNLIGTVFTGTYRPGSGSLPTTECIIYAFSATHWRVVFLDNVYTSPYDFNPSTVSSTDFFDTVIVY